MKRRPNILIYMEILALLHDGPRGPTRLAQALGLNFDKLLEFTAYLESKHVIRKEVRDGHDMFFITPEGVETRQHWREVWKTLGPDGVTDLR